MKYAIAALCFCLIFILSGCEEENNTVYINDSEMELLSELRLGNDTKFNNIPFGGVSGLDALPQAGRFLALSDDRSEKANARFYEIDISIADKKISGVNVLSSTDILDVTGAVFAPKKVDPEALRYNAVTDSIIWSSEIDAVNQPMLREMNRQGVHISEYVLPDKLFNTAAGKGHVASASLESVALSPDKGKLFVATEAALQQDGKVASITNGSPVRILQINAATKQVEAEYLYMVDPIPHASSVADNPLSDNGLSELLSLGGGKLVAIERAGRHTGNFNFAFAAKAYLINLNTATNIKDIESLSIADVRKIQPAVKHLLVDFGRESLASVDNIEAVALGPVIDDAQTLIFASDNNFNNTQINQFLLYKEGKSKLLSK